MSMKARKKQYKHQPLVDVLGRFADVLDEYRINAKRVEICLIKRFFYERLDIQLEFKDQVTNEKEKEDIVPVVLPPDNLSFNGHLSNLPKE